MILLASNQTGYGSIEKYAKNTPCTVKKRLNAGTVVKKGDELVFYEESVKKKKQNSNTSSMYFMTAAMVASEVNSETAIEKKSLTAPCDGVVFFIESNKKGEVSERLAAFLEVYVVSYFDDFLIDIRKNSGGYSYGDIFSRR